MEKSPAAIILKNNNLSGIHIQGTGYARQISYTNRNRAQRSARSSLVPVCNSGIAIQLIERSDPMKHLSAICLILAALMLCACAPAVPVQPAETVTPVPTAVPTVAPTVAPTATVEPTAAPTPEATPILGRREQERPYWHEIWELLYDQGWLAVPYPNYIYD